MTLAFEPVDYSDLNSAQKENYNYHKISARLADYGYTTIRLYDDFQGADFIAKHVDNGQLLLVQLKGRLTFDKKYERGDGEDPIHIAFRDGNDWYLYPHDELLQSVFDHEEISIIEGTKAWDDKGTYHIGSPSDTIKELLSPYRVPVPNA